MSTVRASRARSRGGLNRRLASIVWEMAGRKCKQTGARADSILSASTTPVAMLDVATGVFLVHRCTSGLKCREHCLCAAIPLTVAPLSLVCHYFILNCKIAQSLISDFIPRMFLARVSRALARSANENTFLLTLSAWCVLRARLEYTGSS